MRSLSVPDSLHEACFWGSSMSSHGSACALFHRSLVFHHTVLPSFIYSFICWYPLGRCLVWAELSWDEQACDYMFSFLPGNYLGMGLLNPMISVCFNFKTVRKSFPKWLDLMTHPLAGQESSSCFIVLPTLGFIFNGQNSQRQGWREHHVDGYRTLKSLRKTFTVCSYKGTCLRFSPYTQKSQKVFSTEWRKHTKDALMGGRNWGKEAKVKSSRLS